MSSRGSGEKGRGPAGVEQPAPSRDDEHGPPLEKS